jgi:hypothetical protein
MQHTKHTPINLFGHGHVWYIGSQMISPSIRWYWIEVEKITHNFEK